LTKYIIFQLQTSDAVYNGAKNYENWLTVDEIIAMKIWHSYFGRPSRLCTSRYTSVFCL